jgi:ABC-2 type transport system ATP-binding protein
MLKVANLSVSRNTTFRLTLPELHVPPGAIVCITGPNGSGKTTLMECLTGVLVPTTGTITLRGQPITNQLWTSKAAIGFAPDDEAWFVKELTAREYWRLLQRIYREAGVTADMEQNVITMANDLHFTAYDQQLVRLSHGNKKKVQLIAALMHQPALIIVDELRNGLDPLAIIAAETLLVAHAKAGASIIAATHDLWWAERIADTVVLLVDGGVAANISADAIKKQYGSLEHLFMQTVRGAR